MNIGRKAIVKLIKNIFLAEILDNKMDIEIHQRDKYIFLTAGKIYVTISCERNFFRFHLSVCYDKFDCSITYFLYSLFTMKEELKNVCDMYREIEEYEALKTKEIKWR